MMVAKEKDRWGRMKERGMKDGKKERKNEFEQ